MKNNRNYDRLLHANGDKYNRTNSDDILKKAINTNDLYYRDFYFVTSNSTDDYANKLVSERWKDFRIVDDEPDVVDDSSVHFSLVKSMDFEREIDKITNPEFMKVVIFFTIIHEFYSQFSYEFQEKHEDLKDHLIERIKLFQKAKDGKKQRVSKITTSYQKFLVMELGTTENYVKKHKKAYDKLTTKVFK